MSKNLEISFLLDFYGNVLTEKQRDVMEQYYNDDFSLSEIADNFGITRQGVRDSIKRGENVITELEEQIGMANRYKTMQEGIVELEKIAKDISFSAKNSYSPNSEINVMSEKMLEIIEKISD